MFYYELYSRPFEVQRKESVLIVIHLVIQLFKSIQSEAIKLEVTPVFNQRLNQPRGVKITDSRVLRLGKCIKIAYNLLKIIVTRSSLLNIIKDMKCSMKQITSSLQLNFFPDFISVTQRVPIIRLRDFIWQMEI